MVEKLLEMSCDVNALNPLNMHTPLHYAAKTAHIPIIEALLDNGANVNDKTDTGATPIMLAVQHKHNTVITKLIEAQANIEIYDNDRVTPLDYLIRRSYRNSLKSFLAVCTRVSLSTSHVDIQIASHAPRFNACDALLRRPTLNSTGRTQTVACHSSTPFASDSTTHPRETRLWQSSRF